MNICVWLKSHSNTWLNFIQKYHLCLFWIEWWVMVVEEVDLEGWVDGWTDGWNDGWMDEWTEGWANGGIYGNMKVKVGQWPKFNVNIIKSLIKVTPNLKTQMFLISSFSYLCLIHWIQVLSREWRCSWSSADRRFSNYIWVIQQFYCLLRCDSY